MLATTHRVPPVPAGARILVCARVFWDREEISVAYAHARGELRLRALVPTAEDRPVARRFADGLALILPTGAPVPAGKGMTLREGRTRIELSIVEDDAPDFSARTPRATRGVLLGIGAAVALHAAMVIGALASGPSRQDIQASSEKELAGYMAAAEVRAEREVVASMTEPRVAIVRDETVTAAIELVRTVGTAFV